MKENIIVSVLWIVFVIALILLAPDKIETSIEDTYHTKNNFTIVGWFTYDGSNWVGTNKCSSCYDVNGYRTK